MIEVGKINKLIVKRDSFKGFYLSELDGEQEVFVPLKSMPKETSIDQEIDLFVYLDTDGEMIGSVQIPNAVVGEYALMSVVDTQEFGAFFDWGIKKDLLVPGNEQKDKVRRYEKCLVRVCLEEGTNRVYGTTKLGKYIESSEFDIYDGDKIKIVPVQKNDLGYRVIINKKFIGMIYSNEIFVNIIIGETYDGVVKKIREDGLVDTALQVQGIKNLVEAKDKILNILTESNGIINLNDKSSSEEIKAQLGMSKTTFKKAIGMLYKGRFITINNDGIKLN